MVGLLPAAYRRTANSGMVMADCAVLSQAFGPIYSLAFNPQVVPLPVCGEIKLWNLVAKCATLYLRIQGYVWLRFSFFSGRWGAGLASWNPDTGESVQYSLNSSAKQLLKQH